MKTLEEHIKEFAFDIANETLRNWTPVLALKLSSMIETNDGYASCIGLTKAMEDLEKEVKVLIMKLYEEIIDNTISEKREQGNDEQAEPRSTDT